MLIASVIALISTACLGIRALNRVDKRMTREEILNELSSLKRREAYNSIGKKAEREAIEKLINRLCLELNRLKMPRESQYIKMETIAPVKIS